MSNYKSGLWCVWKKCNDITEKRHFFLFPKENDRWLQWIQACGRFDLTVMGPEYAHRNYRLCHLHFEDKWYKIGKSRASLHPDAIPTIFFGSYNTLMTTAPEEQVEDIQEKNNMEDKEKRTISETIGKEQQQKKTNSDIHQSSKAMSMDGDAEIAESSISNSRYSAAIKETQWKKILWERNLKLKAENRILRERIRWLQKKMKKTQEQLKKNPKNTNSSY